MRLTQVLFSAPHQRSARRPQREPVPFQMLLPLRLKKTVSSKSEKQKEAVCMQQMALMFACFKRNEFNQSECMKEVEQFQDCFNKHRETTSAMREQEKKGILVPGEKKLTHRQLNNLLKSFPPLP